MARYVTIGRLSMILCLRANVTLQEVSLTKGKKKSDSDSERSRSLMIWIGANNHLLRWEL